MRPQDSEYGQAGTLRGGRDRGVQARSWDVCPPAVLRARPLIGSEPWGTGWDWVLGARHE